MTFRVLFIDDDAFMLKALLRTAKRLRPHWLFYGCEQAKDWVSLAEEIAPLDMIICDYQMPEINGEQVLRQATISYPAAVRVLLTGDTSEDIVTRVCQFSHHIVGKPFTEQNILEVFQCVERLQRLPFVAASRARLGQLQDLPVLPDLVTQLREILQNPDVELAQVAALLEHEPAIAAKLIPLANSAFMGFARPVTSILEAVLRLGSKLVEAIVTLHSLEQQFCTKVTPAEHFQITEWAFKHAIYSKKLSQYAGLSLTEQDLAFSAAIFSAIGRLIEISFHGFDLKEKKLTPMIQSGFLNSTLISVYILTLWGHSETLCEVLLWQDTPSPEGNAVEKLSFVLFLAKQMLLVKQDTEIAELQDIIESSSLLAAFNRLLAETGSLNNDVK
ncbi:HDOD domain-containing protein [Alishewanella longhuensis]